MEMIFRRKLPTNWLMIATLFLSTCAPSLSEHDKQTLNNSSSKIGQKIIVRRMVSLNICGNIGDEVCDFTKTDDTISVIGAAVSTWGIGWLQVQTGTGKIGWVDDADYEIAKIRYDNCSNYIPKFGDTEYTVRSSAYCFPKHENVYGTYPEKLEQWVYDDGTYLYFTDGHLSDIQHLDVAP